MKGKAEPVKLWRPVRPRARLGWDVIRVARHAARRPGGGAVVADRDVRAGGRSRLLPAGDHRRRAGHRQEPAVRELFGQLEERPGARALAAGPLPALRGRHLILGARGDREGRVRDPRDRTRRRRRRRSSSGRSPRTTRPGVAAGPAGAAGRRPGRARRAEESFAAWRRFCEGLAGPGDGAGVRGPALGRSGTARLSRPAGRLDEGVPLLAPVHGAAGALRATSEVRRQRRQRAADQPRSADRHGDRPARLGPARARRAARRDAAAAARAGRRQPAVRRGVRTPARRSRRPRRSARCRSPSRRSSPPDWTRWLPTARACSRMRR